MKNLMPINLILLLALTFSSQLIGATQVFFDEANFINSAGILITDSFEGPELFSTPQFTDLDSITTKYFKLSAVSNGKLEYFDWGIASDDLAGTHGVQFIPVSSQQAEYIFKFGAPIRAFGLTILDISSSSFVSFENEVGDYFFSSNGFFGMINADSPYSTVTVAINTNGSDRIIIDNIHFSSVPIPMSFWLFMSGLAMFSLKLKSGNAE